MRVYFSVPSPIESKDFPTKTVAGRRWLIKALHPAEATIKAERAPGKSRYPTAVQEVTSTFVLSCPPDLGDSETWGFRVVTHTDPLVPVEIYHTRQTTGDDEYFAGSYLNQAFVPAGVTAFGTHTSQEMTDAMDRFDAACETYRINALSTTGIFVGATMTDQGSIVSSQFVDATRDCCYVDSRGAGEEYVSAMANLWIDAYPALSEATLGQRPYVSDARSGWYAPQKFDAPGHWQRTNDRALRGRFNGSVSDPNPATIVFSRITRYPTVGDTAATGVTYWIRPYDDSCSQTYVRGLAKTTSFRITVRMALEMGVTPNNTYATFASDPAPPDDLAYELYSETVNQILDAYPSDYNDLGKMWGKIKNVVGKVAKVIDPIAGVASAVGVPYASVIQGIARGISTKGGKFLMDETEGPDSLMGVVQKGMEEATKRAEKRKLKVEAAKAAASKAKK